MYDPIKAFIKDFKRSDVPHELKKREFAMSKSEMRRFKDAIALARKKQNEKRAEKRRVLFAARTRSFEKSVVGS